MCFALPTPPSDPDRKGVERRPPGPLAIFLGGLVLLAVFGLSLLLERLRRRLA